MNNRERTLGSEGPHPLSIEIQDERWLADARDSWSELIADSTANPLFMSWVWQKHWWSHFEGGEGSGQARIITARDEHGSLVGIAPFFTRVSSLRRLRPAMQIAPIGNGWRMKVGEVTEHTDWIVRCGWEFAAPKAIGRYLASELSWDELLFAYTSTHSLASLALHQLAEERGWYIRSEKPIRHYSIDTTVSYRSYVESRGKHTRQRLDRRRKLLATLGRVEIVRADTLNIDSQLQKLEHLSSLRWRDRFPAHVRKFYEALCVEWLPDDKLRLTTLEVDGRPISALFDVEIDGVVYNIRSAIDATFNPRISPGLLHFGYAIEEACIAESIAQYSMLAGPGKHTDYKSHLANIEGTFTSFQLVRRRHEKYMYKLYDQVRNLSLFGYKK